MSEKQPDADTPAPLEAATHREAGSSRPIRDDDFYTEPWACPQCHLVHERCHAHTQRGLPCGGQKMRGQVVCKMHGGMSPQALAAAQARLEKREALKALDTFGLPRAVDPDTALLEELHRTAGVVEWLSQMVATLEADEVGWGRTSTKYGGEDHGTRYEAGKNVWVQMWQEERKHLVAAARACGQQGIEERRILLAEDRGRMLGGAVQRILNGMYEALAEALGEYEAARVIMDRVWPDAVGTIVPAELRAVTATGEDGS